jgi:hypothetical protein
MKDPMHLDAATTQARLIQLMMRPDFPVCRAALELLAPTNPDAATALRVVRARSVSSRADAQRKPQPICAKPSATRLCRTPCAQAAMNPSARSPLARRKPTPRGLTVDEPYPPVPLEQYRVLRRLRDALSRPGALEYLQAQPRSAAIEVLPWVAERLDVER